MTTPSLPRQAPSASLSLSQDNKLTSATSHEATTKMQSGISASSELQSVFNTFVSSPNQRILLVDIQNETLVPSTIFPLQSSDFKQDLSQLQPRLKPNAAIYALLKIFPDSPDGYAAVTYVPNAAPVRQKMLFASTRLTLVRELGIERFRETLFATEASELTAEGWSKHEKHVGLKAPLTEEEESLQGAKEVEMREGGGTMGRKGHVNRGVEMVIGDGVLEALQSLKQEGCKGTLVQLGFKLPNETLVLESTTDNVPADSVAAAISSTEPRYSFYQMQDGEIVFLYTCPSGSKVKERMVYSTGKSWTRIVAERDAGLVVGRSLEATEPAELEGDLLSGSGCKEEAAAETAKPSSGTFARPKRPGRR